MRGLQKGMSMNFMQALAYRRGGKLLLMLGLFAVLSLAFTTFGPNQVLAGGGPIFGKDQLIEWDQALAQTRYWM